MRRVRLRRSDRRAGAPVGARRRRARALGRAVRVRDGRRVSGHEPRAARAWCRRWSRSTATCASSATTTSRSTAGAAPIRRTSSRSTSCFRREDRQARAELPFDKDDPRRRERGDREQQGSPRQGAVVAARRRRAAHARGRARPPRTKRSGSRSRSARCTRHGRRWSDVAILYRSNIQAKVLEEELRGLEVPYVMYGGQQFFERKEVKDVLAYLRVAVSPRDELALRRVINYPGARHRRDDRREARRRGARAAGGRCGTRCRPPRSRHREGGRRRA